MAERYAVKKQPEPKNVPFEPDIREHSPINTRSKRRYQVETFDPRFLLPFYGYTNNKRDWCNHVCMYENKNRAIIVRDLMEKEEVYRSPIRFWRHFEELHGRTKIEQTDPRYLVK
jgi:hypothetical protein